MLLLAAAVGAVAPAIAQSAPQSGDDAFRTLLSGLGAAGYAEKEQAIGQLAVSGHSSTRAVLGAWLDDRLYARTSDQKVFLVKSADSALTSFDLIDPVTLTPAGASPLTNWRRSAPTTGFGASCGRPWRDSICRRPTCPSG